MFKLNSWTGYLLNDFEMHYLLYCQKRLESLLVDGHDSRCCASVAWRTFEADYSCFNCHYYCSSDAGCCSGTRLCSEDRDEISCSDPLMTDCCCLHQEVQLRLLVLDSCLLGRCCCDHLSQESMTSCSS